MTKLFVIAIAENPYTTGENGPVKLELEEHQGRICYARIHPLDVEFEIEYSKIISKAIIKNAILRELNKKDKK